MVNIFLIFFGNFIAIISRILNLGHGTTWPGHVALSINKNFIKEITKTNPHLKIILIAGTNGKTTTGRLVQAILENSKYKVFQNEAGANLLNGIASSILLHSDILCKINYDYAIFEVDENTLPLILKELTPDYLILLNLFRDQLDRYGEVNTIANKWRDAIVHLLPKTTLILNADDPQVANLRLHLEGVNVKFFGLNDKKLATSKTQHAADSTYCLNCGSKLSYSSIFYSHLGIWDCPRCNNHRPKLNQDTSPLYPLWGIYNRYNTIAAVLLARQIDIKEDSMKSALREFKPAFGRQEILKVDGKKVQVFLSKNPTSFNESLRTVADLDAKNALFVLNDRIPDGHDVSWIWDVDFEDYVDQFKSIIISGDRCYDIALRLKYAVQSSKFKVQSYSAKCKVYEDLKKAISEGTRLISNGETLYVLPTYSAMLEVRKILTGKKLL